MPENHEGSSSGGAASIRSVARRAGVSPSTASRALRGTLVAEATRQRVVAAAHELGYRRPRPAERTHLVAVLCRYPSQWYFAEAITALERTLVAQSCRLVLHTMSDPESRAAFFDRELSRRDFDGIIVVSTSFSRHEDEALAAVDLPIVVIGGHLPGRATVGIDERAAARTATEHLIALGHRRIGLLSFEPADSVGTVATNERRQGFESALADNDVRLVEDWIMIAAGSRMGGGHRAAEQLLSRPQLPTAVFAMSDELAIGALRAVRRAGLTVPGRLSIVGLDDHEMAEYADLTTVRQPVRRQAEIAGLLLADQIRARTAVPALQQVATRLIVRGTTAPPLDGRS